MKDNEAQELARVLRGMVECSTAPDDLWDRDQADGDPFVIRAAELLVQQAHEIRLLRVAVDTAIRNQPQGDSE